MRKKVVGLTLSAMLFALSFPVWAQQQPKIPKIGGSEAMVQESSLELFKRELRTLGYVEGKNLGFEHRSAEGKLDRLPALAEELVRLKVAVLLTSLAQYTCPWAITIQRLQVCVSRRQKRLDRSTYPSPRRLDSSPQSLRQGRDARRIRPRLPYKPGFVTSSIDGITARHHGKSCREWRSLSSYREYNQATVPAQTYGADWLIQQALGKGNSRTNSS